ncbi:MAG: hypothetical protein IJZ39_08445 [Oscillospiraceae bacterium]|nr:hypothetical protein [Oscillospiraceae bacterium]
MARKADIQYIRHSYIDGTAAKKLAERSPKKAPLPLFEPRMLEPDQKVEVRVDPLSVAATITAVVLVVLMVVSLLQFGAAYQQNVELQEYVYVLRNENLRLEQEYRASYDLAEIEAQALALGMVPAEQAQTMYISGAVPAEPAQPTFWENVELIFSELFANAKV